MENRCYDADCLQTSCFNPKHYNYICFDPNCDEIKCTNSNHYNKQLLKDLRKNMDLDAYEHEPEHDDCCSHDHAHEHSHGHEHEHDHSHEHEHEHDDCCSNDHSHEHSHSHEHEHDECCSHDHNDVDISLCNCSDCDDSENKELFAEGEPLIYNRPVQIIAASGLCFVSGLIMEYLSFSPTAVTVIFMFGALFAGYEIAVLAFKSLINKHTVGPAMLVTIACIASFIIGHPEEGAAVTFLYFIAEFLEDYAEHRAKRSIKSLVEMAPDTARVKVGDLEEIRNVDYVKIGDVVIVKPGDKVPLDGEVIFGSSSINQASITGESVPVLKQIGDEVFSGTVNEDGYLEIKVSKQAKDSVISKIVEFVKNSQVNKSQTETLVERIAKYYTPIMMVAALCVALIPPVFFGQDLTDWVYKALSLLVISCPCAFLISTPVGMVSAITSATRNGVLIKGSSYIEQMRGVKAVIFDKTGTLTEGKLVLNDVVVLDENYSKEEIIKIAASIENKSSHPIAQAIVNYANENDISLVEVDDFKNVPGKGIIANIEQNQYYAANESLIEGSSFDLSRDEINKYASEGKTVVFIGNSEKLLAIITVADKIRDNAREIIVDLKKQNIQTVMLTGDNKIAAKSVASEIGIDYVYSNLMPEDKLNLLEVIRNKFGSVAMVGDGVNDAPALACADIGIAMGATGSDVAIETADIALMQDDISKIPYLFSLSNKTMRIIKQDISIAIAVKMLCVIFAILGVITLMMSVGFGDLGLTMLVILNSFRIGMVKDSLF